MNRKEAAELLPFIRAFAEGKIIEFKDKRFKDKWDEMSEFPNSSFKSFEYRIKPQSKYRSFANAEECLQEMQKHQPFEWLKIDDWYCTIKEIRPTCTFCHGGGDVFYYADMVKKINFADGTPFGIKEEEQL